MLGVQGAFECVGLTGERGINKFVGKQLGNGVTYIDRKSKSLGRMPASPRTKRSFRPEFAGVRNITHPGSYTAKSDHGKVVEALHGWLVKHGHTNLDNIRQRYDLHSLGSDGNASELYEVKTSSTTTDVYTAIGQLMIYERQLGQASSKFMVLPFTEQVTGWMSRLGISGQVGR